MNKTSFAAIAIALTSLAAGQAMAAKAPYVNETNMPSIAASAVVTTNKSRAEVQAELVVAQRNGEIASTKNVESELPSFRRPAESAVAGKSRDQVRAELVAARAVPAAVEIITW